MAVAVHSADEQIENITKRLHNKLLYTTIAINYLHHTVDNGVPEQMFRANVKSYLEDPLTSSGKDVTRLLEILESKGHIGIGDYDILKDIVNFDKKLIQEIYDMELVMRSYGTNIYERRLEGKFVKKDYVDRDILLRVEQDSKESGSVTVDSPFKEKITAIEDDLLRHESTLGISEHNDYEAFNEKYKLHNERLKCSLVLLRAFNDSSFETEILTWASKSSELIKKDDGHFFIFQRRWKEFNDRLKERNNVHDMLSSWGMKKRKIDISSLYIFLQAENIKKLDSFWKEYTAGTITKQIKQILFMNDTDETDESILLVTITEENYVRYRTFICDQKEVVLHLRDTAIHKNESTEFVCETKHAKTKVTWFVNGMEIHSKGRFLLKQLGCSHRLIIRNVDVTDSGRVTAVVGTEQTSALLTVTSLHAMSALSSPSDLKKVVRVKPISYVSSIQPSAKSPQREVRPVRHLSNPEPTTPVKVSQEKVRPISNLSNPEQAKSSQRETTEVVSPQEKYPVGDPQVKDTVKESESSSTRSSSFSRVYLEHKGFFGTEKTSGLNGMLVLSDGIIISSLLRGLFLFSNDGTLFDNIERKEIWGITKTKRNAFAILEHSKVSTWKLGLDGGRIFKDDVEFELGHYTHGFFSNGTYFCSIQDNVREIAITLHDYIGRFHKRMDMKNITLGKNTPSSYIYMEPETHKIFLACTDERQRKKRKGILCLDIEGTVLWFTPLDNAIPVAITQVQDVLCVSDELSTLHLLSLDGKYGQELMKIHHNTTIIDANKDSGIFCCASFANNVVMVYNVYTTSQV